jgi:(2R)-sulfolactate sulfo-lyase subunit beta
MAVMAAGAILHLFLPTVADSRGHCNVIGNPIMPVIEITANPQTVSSMPEHIDLDVSGLLQRTNRLENAGDDLMQLISRTINGRLTTSELLGRREFDLTKLHRSG